MKAQRFSKQRELVLKTVKANLIHPTALEVYGMTREVDPTISMGTVYRNLNLLAEQGKILRIKVPGGADRYDGTIEPHLQCSGVDKVCLHSLEYKFALF